MIAVETIEIENAWEIAQATIDIIQFDQVTYAELKPFLSAFKSQYPAIKLAVAGDITLDNVEEYVEQALICWSPARRTSVNRLILA